MLDVILEYAAFAVLGLQFLTIIAVVFVVVILIIAMAKGNL